MFRAVGVRVIRSAVQAPRMNSIMERWIGSCRRDLLDRTILDQAVAIIAAAKTLPVMELKG